MPMSSANIHDSNIEKYLDEIPQHVTNRMVLSAIIENRKSLETAVEKITRRTEKLTERVDALERAMQEEKSNPALTWYLRNKPVEVMKVAVIFLALIGINNFPQWIDLVFKHFGG